MKVKQEYCPRTVYVDGLDLSGKSSVCRILREKNIGGMYRHKTLGNHNPFVEIARRIKEDFPMDSRTRQALYIDAIEWDIKNYSKRPRNTIQESTLLLKSLAIDKTFNPESVLTKEYSALAKKHPLFDRAFILTANIQTRQRRLAKRMQEHPESVTNNDRMVLERPELFMAIEGSLIDFGKKIFNAEVVDTTGMGINDVVSHIESKTR